MTTTIATADLITYLITDLERRGVTLSRNGDRLRIVPAEKVAEEELEELRRHKAEILEALDTWNEDAARRRLAVAWDWADDVTPPGCWAALPADVRRDLQTALDAAYDRIDSAFVDQDPQEFAAGLDAFRAAVMAAVEHEAGRGYPLENFKKNRHPYA